MTIRGLLRATLTGGFLMVAGAVSAQSVTLYRDPGFRGPALAVERDEANLRLNFDVFAVRVTGGAWELCPQPGFRGRCLTVGQSTADLRRTYGWPGPLQSIRRVDDTRPPPGGGGSGGGSLRGMASEFFPAPVQGRGRVPACPSGSATATCAAATADRFCRSEGWNGAGHQLMQTERGRIYLADVLCVRAGF